jgi:hypothetical protein
VPQLPADPERTAQQRAVDDDAAAEPGAHGEQHHVIDVPGGAEPELAPGRGVGVVLHQHRQAGPLLDVRPQRLVPPGQVRREEHHRPGPVDVPRCGDADRGDLVPASQLGDGVSDGRLDRLDVLGRGLPPHLCQQLAVLRHHPGRDLRPADVDSDGVHGLCCSCLGHELFSRWCFSR